MAVVLCILRIDNVSGKVYNKTDAQISLAIKKSITGTGFIPRPLKIDFFSSFLEKFFGSVLPSPAQSIPEH